MEFVSKEQSDIFFKLIRRRKGNDCCFECGKSGATWTSLKHAVFICTSCADKHRSMGLRLKSILLDSYTENDLKRIKHGGNEIGKMKGINDSMVKELDAIVLNDKESVLEVKEEENNIFVPKIKIKEVPKFGKLIEKEKEKELVAEKEPETTLKSIKIKNQNDLEIKKDKYKLDGVSKNRIGFGVVKIKKDSDQEK